MGLTVQLLGAVAEAVSRWGTARPHVMLLEMPGGRAECRGVQDDLDDRGWVRAHSPGTADVLVLAGGVTDSLAPYVERLWAQLPGPRTPVVLTDPDPVRVGVALDEARGRLRDLDRQHADVTSRPDPTTVGRGEHEPAEPSTTAPFGIPLAAGVEDRDGLEMDALRVPLGPALDHWPAGLVLHTELHGDLVADARVTWLGHDHSPAPDDLVERTGRVLDAVSDVAELAGDPRAARAARALRRRTLDDVAGSRAQTRSDLDRLATRLASRTARTTLGPAATVLADQLHGLRADHGDRDGETVDGADTGRVDDAGLRAAVVGRDLGDVRLLVAALAPRLTLAHDVERVRHG